MDKETYHKANKLASKIDDLYHQVKMADFYIKHESHGLYDTHTLSIGVSNQFYNIPKETILKIVKLISEEAKSKMELLEKEMEAL